MNMDDASFDAAERSIREVMEPYSQNDGRMSVAQYKNLKADQMTQAAEAAKNPAATPFSTSAWLLAHPGKTTADGAAATAQAKAAGHPIQE